MSIENANGERIETMTDTDRALLGIKRRLDVVEYNNRKLLDINKSLEINVKYLMELNKPETKRNEG